MLTLLPIQQQLRQLQRQQQQLSRKNNNLYQNIQRNAADGDENDYYAVGGINRIKSLGGPRGGLGNGDDLLLTPSERGDGEDEHRDYLIDDHEEDEDGFQLVQVEMNPMLSQQQHQQQQQQQQHPQLELAQLQQRR